jgi:chemotaxis protein MotB
MARKHKKKEEDNPDEWLVTYADAVTLILCFFILMFSVSKPQEDDFKKISDAFKAVGLMSEDTKDSMSTLAEEMLVMLEESNIMIDGNRLEEVMSVEQDEDGISLELAGGSFYHSGSAKFRAEAIPVLEEVSLILQDFDYDAYEIHVEGHTDDVPIRSQTYPSNWELSGNRAANVVRFFIADGMTPELLSATGYAETRPKVPNLDEFGNPIPRNREINRRVVIRVERID